MMWNDQQRAYEKRLRRSAFITGLVCGILSQIAILWVADFLIEYLH